LGCSQAIFVERLGNMRSLRPPRLSGFSFQQETAEDSRENAAGSAYPAIWAVGEVAYTAE